MALRSYLRLAVEFKAADSHLVPGNVRCTHCGLQHICSPQGSSSIPESQDVADPFLFVTAQVEAAHW